VLLDDGGAPAAPEEEELPAATDGEEPAVRVADEVELYEAAYSVRMPMMLKGPTGCGKSTLLSMIPRFKPSNLP
jgi:ABC-type lipoprotein export system ATPase subunit